jgi:hypothetical protein
MASKAAGFMMIPSDLDAQRHKALRKLWRKPRRRSKLPAQGFESLVRDGLAAERPSPDGEETICVLTMEGYLRARSLAAQRKQALRELYRQETVLGWELLAQGFDSLVYDGLAVEQPSPSGSGTIFVLTKKGERRAIKVLDSDPEPVDHPDPVPRVSYRGRHTCGQCGLEFGWDPSWACPKCEPDGTRPLSTW